MNRMNPHVKIEVILARSGGDDLDQDLDLEVT